jgi:hypothetical protein
VGDGRSFPKCRGELRSASRGCGHRGRREMHLPSASTFRPRSPRRLRASRTSGNSVPQVEVTRARPDGTTAHPPPLPTNVRDRGERRGSAIGELDRCRASRRHLTATSSKKSRRSRERMGSWRGPQQSTLHRSARGAARALGDHNVTLMSRTIGPARWTGRPRLRLRVIARAVHYPREGQQVGLPRFARTAHKPQQPIEPPSGQRVTQPTRYRNSTDP